MGDGHRLYMMLHASSNRDDKWVMVTGSIYDIKAVLHEASPSMLRQAIAAVSIYMVYIYRSLIFMNSSIIKVYP